MRIVPAALGLFTLILLMSCGKVGDPQPPIVRIPKAVTNLAASQVGNRIVLTWTNPSQYVDQNPASELGEIHILRNGVQVGAVAAMAAGTVQSFEVEVPQNQTDRLSFTVQVGGRGLRGLSESSNVASVLPADVPGAPRNLTAVVDQFRIVLSWDPPESYPEFAEAYIVQRTDRTTADIVQTTRFEDSSYEPGKMYSYVVTSARGVQADVRGVGTASVSVIATDTRPPATPAEIRVERLGPQVILRWRANTERDFKDVLVFRSDSTDPVAVTPVDGFVDTTYRPGLSYQLVARDVFDNLSPRSAAQPGP